MDKFKSKELPRVIYHFITDDNKITKIMDLEELDGVFYLPKQETLKIKDLPFIVDDIFEADNSEFDFSIQNNDYIQFTSNSLILLEVKNRFPGTNYDSTQNQIDKELKSELINLCDKILAFYELYNERFEITKILIILFYDVIPKSNYDRVLSNVFKHYFYNKRLEEIRNKIQFQCTFIISSYFAYTIKNFIDKTNALELKINENERKLKNEIDEMASLKEKFQKIEKDNIYFKNIINNYQNNIIPKLEKDKDSLEKEANDYKKKYLEIKDKSSNGLMNGKKVWKRNKEIIYKIILGPTIS